MLFRGSDFPSGMIYKCKLSLSVNAMKGMTLLKNFFCRANLFRWWAPILSRREDFHWSLSAMFVRTEQHWQTSGATLQSQLLLFVTTSRKNSRTKDWKDHSDIRSRSQGHRKKAYCLIQLSIILLKITTSTVLLELLSQYFTNSSDTIHIPTCIQFS